MGSQLELVVFVGLPGSGKSYYYNARFAATHAHVSKDQMRSARDKAGRQARVITQSLEKGTPVVVDNTNVKIADRAELIRLGKEHGAKLVCYYFVPSIGRSLKQNRLRSGKEKVPDVAIFAFKKRLQPPTYAEGFDEIYEVTFDEQNQPCVILVARG